MTNWSRLARILLPAQGLLLALALTGCSVREATPDSITVQYDTLHPEFAQIEANQHCKQYGKTAVLVDTRPVESSMATLMLNSSVSTFNCVGGMDRMNPGPPPGIQ